MTNEVDVLFKCTDYYDPPGERGIPWNDPLLAIKWPADRPLLSEKDASYRPLSPNGDALPPYPHVG